MQVASRCSSVLSDHRENLLDQSRQVELAGCGRFAPASQQELHHRHRLDELGSQLVEEVRGLVELLFDDEDTKHSSRVLLSP